MLKTTKSALVLVLIVALAGCSDDTSQESASHASTSQTPLPEESNRGEIQGQPSMLGTVAGAAVGATVGTMLGNSLSNQEKDREQGAQRTNGVAPYAGGIGSGSERVKPSTRPALPKANIISRGGSFSGMNAGS